MSTEFNKPIATDGLNEVPHAELHGAEIDAINTIEEKLEELDSEKLAIVNKSTGAEIDTGTDNDKYVTSKGIADSKISFTDGVETLTNKTAIGVGRVPTADIDVYKTSGNAKYLAEATNAGNQASYNAKNDIGSITQLFHFGSTETSYDVIKSGDGGIFNLGGDLDLITEGGTNINIKSIGGGKINLLSPTTAMLNAPQGFLINGKIVRTVDGSGNMTVAIKTLAGNDPSATDPVYCRIGNTVRSITSACYKIIVAWSLPLFNSGSAELATKEIDYFVYLVYNSTNGVGIGISRIPYGRIISDFNIVNVENEKYIQLSIVTTATDEVELIGRFNATLSAGPTYTWSIPATDIIINKWERDTKKNDWTSALSVGVGSVSSSVLEYSTYTIKNHILHFELYGYFVSNNAITNDFIFSLPFKELNSYLPVSCMADVPSTGQRVLRGYIANSSCKVLLESPLTSGQTVLFRIAGDYEI